VNQVRNLPERNLPERNLPDRAPAAQRWWGLASSSADPFVLSVRFRIPLIPNLE
jgi:hypothetical protein